MKKPRVASFFAGIGGFDLGFKEAEFEVNFQCEMHRFCTDVLKYHWPDVLLAGDISSVEPKSIPGADIWCGGFPCQDLSVARGSRGRRGLNGSRSGLFFRFASLAQKKKPRVILIENVHGLLNSNDGKDFAELLHTLESMNYAVAWRLLNSRYFGIPQSRPRVFICAWLNNPIPAGNTLFEDQPPNVDRNQRSAFLETSWVSGPGPIAPKLAFCLAATSGRHTGTDWSRTYIAYMDAVRRLSPLECERLQGFPDSWTKIDLAPNDPERSDSLRYHALGNAVSVAVVKWIATRIRNELKSGGNAPRKAKARLDFLNDSLRRWPGLVGPARITGELASIRQSRAKFIWPHAGILWKGNFVANRTPPSQYKPGYSNLLHIIERNRPEPRYFLSPNAAEGILRRVDSQGRVLFPPLRQALERLSGRKLNFHPSVPRSFQPLPQLELPLSETICVSP